MDQAAVEPALVAQWDRVRGRLRTEIAETDFRHWIGPMVVERLERGTLKLGLPSRFMRDMVERRFRDRLRSLWVQENPQIQVVEVTVSRAGVGAPPEAAAPTAVPPVVAAPVEETDGVRPNARMTFATFVKDVSNELALAAARQAASGVSTGLNPLFMWGGVGHGKTHLLHAIAWGALAEDPRRRVLLLTAELFMHEFVQALRQRDTGAFKQRLRGVDLLLIDDLQFIDGKDVTQDEFLHTFDALIDRGAQIVIAADKPPAGFVSFSERLKTRLQQGLVAQIQPATPGLRRAFLAERCREHAIPTHVLDYLAQKIQGNIRELEGALNRLIKAAELCGGPITLERADALMVDLLRGGGERRITIDDIQRRVAEHYGIRLADMTSARRARAVARPRQVAMYLAKQLTPRSLPEIGKRFGGRDHTTVMHAVRKIEDLRASDPGIADDVELLRRLIES
jgi:chromosomal replication initiator protein